VVVQGAGGLGLYACAVAASSGARVVVVEQQRDRVELARQFGATDALDLSQCTDGRERAARVLDATGGLGADIVLEVTGRAGAFSEAIDFARIGRISWQTTGANTHSAR
jgi:L-iditol 2-dehydrogenase